MPRSTRPKLVEYADPADLNPVSPLRLRFMHSVHSHPDARAAFLRSLYEKVWPTYRTLTIDVDWPTIRRVSSDQHPELIPLRESLTTWAHQLHFLNAAGEPCPWLIATALGMIRRWKCTPSREGEFLHGGEYMLLASELPAGMPLSDKFRGFTFSYQHEYNGMPLGVYEMELQAAVNQEVAAHIAKMRAVAERDGVRVPSKASDVHFGWLVQNLVLARSAAQIIEHCPPTYRQAYPASVSEAIRGLASQLGLKPRRSSGGRPSRR